MMNRLLTVALMATLLGCASVNQISSEQWKKIIDALGTLVPTTGTTTPGPSGGTPPPADGGSASAPGTTPTPAAGADALDLTTVAEWYGPSDAKGAKKTATLTAASMGADTITVEFKPYGPWEADESSSKPTDAVCYLFYERDGKVVGGKFDFWRKGGQSVKTLANVHEGYNGHAMPAAGARVWTMISSKDFSERSNTVEVKR